MTYCLISLFSGALKFDNIKLFENTMIQKRSIITVFLLLVVLPVSAYAKVLLRGGTRLSGGLRITASSPGGGGAGTSTVGLIGTPGAQGFGVGLCPSSDLPSGFNPLSGYADVSSDNYGNYQYSDGSIMVFVPKFYYKIGTGSNGLSVNEVDVKGIDTFSTTADANAAGYALHRAFIDGGTEKSGFFIDKYECSNNGGVASSIKNAQPISTDELNNPIANLTACTNNAIYETINAAHGRGSIFNVSSRFMYAALAILSMAHGDAAGSTDYCAWYDASGVTNFPKGGNEGVTDRDDNTVTYTSTGYSRYGTYYCGKTGSAVPFAKTTHNGQNSGIADLNGVMAEVSLGLTSYSYFYVLKESISLKDLKPGVHLGASGADYEAWGDDDHLSLYYDQLSLPQISNGLSSYFGNDANQVLSESLSGDGWLYTALGVPMSNTGKGATGTARFGFDEIYEKQPNKMALVSGGVWSGKGKAGLWAVSFYNYREWYAFNIGFRCACYP